jgi:hypothetical protein
MSTIKARTLTPGLLDEISSIISILGETEGGVYYVSTSGSDDNDGTTPENAFRTLTYAISQCTSGQNDRIFMFQGTYDEPSATGVPINKSNLTIQGIKSPIVITNSNTTGDKVLNLTANNVTLVNIQVKKGETTSSGSTCIYIDGANNPRFRDVKIVIEKAGFYGYRYTGGAQGGYIGFGDRRYSLIISNTLTQTGIGIYFENCIHVLVEDLCIYGMEKGLLFAADGDDNAINYGVTIAYSTTGIELESGASNNGLCSSVIACNIDLLDNSGNATNDFHGSLTHIHDSVEHIEKYTGKIWYVDGTNGSDTNSGENPHEAFATIGNALNNMSEGDAVTVRTGDYYEDNLQLNQIGTELWGEIGTVIHTTTTTGLTISARDCRVNEIILSPIGHTAIDLQGNYCVLENITCITPSIGISISGRGNRLKDILIAIPTTTGLDVSGPYNWAKNVFVIGNEGATRGYYLSTSDADQNIFEMCHSIANATAGYETVAGANLNSFIKCTSGSGDGVRVDTGTNNFWDIVEVATAEHHEHMYPFSDGAGTAALPITVDNTATDDLPDTRSDRWYWGDTVAIIPQNILTTIWFSVGIYIYATTTNKILQWQVWFPDGKINSARNGGNAWSYSQTVITVTDGSIFEVDDLVWLTSTSDPDGEIQKITNIAGNVITLVSETRFSGNVGIRYNHVGGETMYLIYRATDPRYMPFEGGYSAGSAKESSRVLWHNERELSPNSAMIIRILNTLDALDASFDVSALYYDL